jgi:hypothetical protein
MADVTTITEAQTAEDTLVLDSAGTVVETEIGTIVPEGEDNPGTEDGASEDGAASGAASEPEEDEEDAPARSYNRWTPNSNQGVEMDEMANMRQRFQELANAVHRVEQTYDKHGDDPDTLERLLRQYGEPKAGTGWVGRTIAKIGVLTPLMPDSTDGKRLRGQASKRVNAARAALATLAAEYAADNGDAEAEGEEDAAE